MYGLLIALLYFGFEAVVKNVTMPTAFAAAAGVLFVWYLAWFAVAAAIMSLVTLGFTGGSGLAGRLAGGRLGGVAGLVAGATLSFWSWVNFLVHWALFIGGAWCLHTAGQAGMGFSEFSTTRLIVGALLIFVGLLTGGRSRSRDD